MIQKGITTGYLEQGPLLDDTKTIREYIATGHSGLFPIVERYLRAVDAQAEDFNEVTQKEFGEATAEMEAAGAGIMNSGGRTFAPFLTSGISINRSKSFTEANVHG